MSMMRALLSTTILLAGAICHAASAGSPGGTSVSNAPVAAFGQAYVRGLLSPIAGPNNALYTAYADDPTMVPSYVARVGEDGNATMLHTFSLLTTDPVSGMLVNADGGPVSRLVNGKDGNVYGVTGYGGPKGYGTFFMITPDDRFTSLANLDFSAYTSIAPPLPLNTEFVQGVDGNFYGFAYLGDSSLFYRLSSSGAFTALCHWDSGTLLGDGLMSLVAASDGTFFAFANYEVVRFAPSDCAATVFYSGPVSPFMIMGGDGNLYLAQSNGLVPQTNKVIRLKMDGTASVLAQFAQVQYRFWVPGHWWCKIGCTWMRGFWENRDTPISAQGYGPRNFLWGNDGSLYFDTSAQGLLGQGANMRIGADGSLTTLIALDNTWKESTLAQFADGRLARFTGNSAAPIQPAVQLTLLSTQSSLGTSVSFSNPAVWLWQPTTLTWSSTGAVSCELTSDIPGPNPVTQPVATSGSQTFTLYSNGLRTPPQFTAGIQCTAADGSISNAAATLTVK